ncbi:MAG: hypothetical protein HUK20_07410 [Fibrobacter sp.]|nr:hypothetical protein [Fibrobacter sp.]
MAEDVNYSELRNYLSGQIELGCSDIYFDEPWSLKPRTVSRPAPPIPQVSLSSSAVPQTPAATVHPSPIAPPSMSRQAPSPRPAEAPSLDVQLPFSGMPIDLPTPRAVPHSVAEYEQANSLIDFYDKLKSEVVYSKEPSLAQYVGAEQPKLLFVLPSVKTGTNPQEFFATPVGEMLVRLFANLNIAQEAMGLTYFFKSTERAISPLLESPLKKMLAKELSLIAPQIVVPMGQPLFLQLFGKTKKFDDLAGTTMDFAGFKCCPLIDPYSMVNDKQLKWLTWKVHIPRSDLF